MHIDRLALAFENIGHEAVMIDFEDPNALGQLEKELKNRRGITIQPGEYYIYYGISRPPTVSYEKQIRYQYK